MGNDIVKAEETYDGVYSNSISIIIYHIESGITVPVYNLIVHTFPFRYSTMHIKKQLYIDPWIIPAKTDQVFTPRQIDRAVTAGKIVLMIGKGQVSGKTFND